MLGYPSIAMEINRHNKAVTRVFRTVFLIWGWALAPSRRLLNLTWPHLASRAVRGDAQVREPSVRPGRHAARHTVEQWMGSPRGWEWAPEWSVGLDNIRGKSYCCFRKQEGDVGIKLCHGTSGSVSTPWVLEPNWHQDPHSVFFLCPPLAWGPDLSHSASHLGPSQRQFLFSAGADSDQHLNQHSASNPNKHCFSKHLFISTKAPFIPKWDFAEMRCYSTGRYKSQNNYIKEVTSHWKGKGPFSQSLPNSALKPSFGHSLFHVMNVFRVADLRDLFLQDKFSCISMSTCREKFSWGKNISPLNSSPIGQCLPGLS